MKNALLQAAMSLNRSRTQKKWWQRAVRVMAMMVVFCTTYALILPAITMHTEPICGQEGHIHSEECYVQQTTYGFNCGLDHRIRVLHSHDALCYTQTGELICALPEISEHIHSEACYGEVKTLICTYAHEHSAECSTEENVLSCGRDEQEPHTHSEACVGAATTLVCQIPEREGHTHSESCGAAETVLVCTQAEGESHTHGEGCYETHLIPCGLEESEGHAHGESCFETTEIPCQIPETEGHTHSESCYQIQQIPCSQPTTEEHVHEDGCYEVSQALTCGRSELVAHTHDETCRDAEGNLTCGLPQAVAHTHAENCINSVVLMAPKLVCQIPEHVHDDTCFPLEEHDEATSRYLCGSGVHTHVEACRDADGTLVCSIPEHAHEAACLVADLDLTADTETAQQWEAALESLSLTGSWPIDVLTVADSQLGYRESAKNVILSGDDLKGYTRYGAWYGDTYGDWCAMYVAFCLHYAGVEEFPLDSNCANWIENLTALERYAQAADHTPKAGDLIFFDRSQPDSTVHADHMGLVVEVIPATEQTPAQIRTIEGNTADQVACRTYDLADPRILGYGILPNGPVTLLTHQGGDYTVTVTFGDDAGIPENAQLSVREILPGTEEYETYYRQSVDAMLSRGEAETEEDLAVSFARFFDICFLVDGAKVEPTAAVDIRVTYHNAVEMDDTKGSVAVHFAEDGVEILDAEASRSENLEEDQVDTFEFSQDSFSVVGTVVSTYSRAVTVSSATRIHPSNIDGSSKTVYVLYTQIGSSWYAIDGNGYAVPITVNGNAIALPEGTTTDVFWTFTSQGTNTYQIGNVGTSRYLHPFNNSSTDRGVTTAGSWNTNLTNVRNNNYTFRIQANGNYVYFSNAASAAQPSTSSYSTFYIAEVGKFYNVWFDGTLGGMMSYYGAANENQPVLQNTDGSPVTVTLPETWQSSTKYPYKLQGWYDINTQTYYPVDPDDGVDAAAQISADSVFYADWVAATYDVGQDNEHVVDSVDTNDFITTHVFDYNALFNVQSLTHTGTITGASHSETWTLVQNGTVPYKNAATLDFLFVDYDSTGEFVYPRNQDTKNQNQSGITSNILTDVSNVSGKNLLDLLFNHETDVIGKNYVGTGNYLFQYMDSTTENYDGIHDGYYYLDARLNAASYNQTLERFYLYDYLERTSDSDKDGGIGEYSDFLPFNSPYIFGQDDDYVTGTDANAGRVDYYEDLVRRPGWEYDAKDGQSSFQDYNSTGDATTNYFFGIKTEIEFYLPNDTNTTDEYGNYGNISTRGEHMIFDFHGDDDVWVYVDGELLLDIGGMHGVMMGQLDFSTGTIITGKDGGTTTTTSFEMEEGNHVMTVYYMERGSSQSNCAIYFNIAPRYDLEITKEDIVSAEKLDGAVFTIYTCEACANGICADHDAPQVAQLWDSKEAHEQDMDDDSIDLTKSTFTVVDGVAKCWGISAGKTYYIRETTPPPGYPESDDLIRITLNNRGTATIETTTLHGSNGIATEGFAVIKQDVNDTLKIVALTVTNQMEGDTTEVRVEKTWAEGSENLPQSITVYLTADGVPVGRRAVLHEGNGWSYTWTGLPKYKTEGIDEKIVYEVQEVLVPGYITTQGETVEIAVAYQDGKYVDWVRVDQMSDSKTYILVHNDQALTYTASGFSWMDPVDAELDESLSAQWTVTTDHDGFHLKNGLGYTLTFDPDTSSFYGVDNDATALNQVFYYLNSRLVVHDHDVYYQFGSNGSAVSEDGLAFTLYQKEVVIGWLTGITNVPVEEEDQTYVEVNKVWSDGNENHSGSVTIRLYADGADTGRYVVLNAQNNWAGGFYDLPYYREDGVTPVVYTVVEDEVPHYAVEYSDPTILDGLPVVLWESTDSLAIGGIYRFTSGSYALAVDGDGNVIAENSSLDDVFQQWEAVSYNNGRAILLRNVGSQTYLARSGTSLYTTSSQSGAAQTTLSGGHLMLGSYYLEVGAGYAAATNNSANVSNQKVTVMVHTNGKPGTGYTVTNVYGVYTLPNTGGAELPTVTFGMLLILAAALMYMCKFGRKLKKGGRNGNG